MDAGEVGAGAAVDWSVVDALAAEIGDDELGEALAAAYLDELPERHTALVTAIDGAPGALRAAAHGLGSASLSLGATRLGSTCRSVEAAVDDGDPARARSLAAAALPELDRVAAALRTRFPRLT